MKKSEKSLTLKMLSNVYRPSLPDFSVQNSEGKQLHTGNFTSLSLLSDETLNRPVQEISVKSCYGMPAVFVTVS